MFIQPIFLPVAAQPATPRTGRLLLLRVHSAQGASYSADPRAHHPGGEDIQLTLGVLLREGVGLVDLGPGVEFDQLLNTDYFDPLGTFVLTMQIIDFRNKIFLIGILGLPVLSRHLIVHLVGFPKIFLNKFLSMNFELLLIAEGKV